MPETKRKKKKPRKRKASLGVTATGEYRKNSVGQGRKTYYDDGDVRVKISKSFALSRDVLAKLKAYSVKYGVSQSSILEDLAQKELQPTFE